MARATTFFAPLPVRLRLATAAGGTLHADPSNKQRQRDDRNNVSRPSLSFIQYSVLLLPLISINLLPPAIDGHRHRAARRPSHRRVVERERKRRRLDEGVAYGWIVLHGDKWTIINGRVMMVMAG